MENFSERDITCVILSAIFHYAIYYFSSTSHYKADEARSRIASSVHATAVSLVVILYTFFYPFPLYIPNRIILSLELSGDEILIMRSTLCFSIGYFISDSFIMLTNKAVYTRDAMIHHLAIMPFFILGLYTGVCSVYHFIFLIEVRSIEYSYIFHHTLHLLSMHYIVKIYTIVFISNPY
jgi:hypothetical protein